MSKAKPPSRPNRSGSNVNIWVDKSLRARLDAYLASTAPRVPLTNAVEMAIDEFLASKGFPAKEGK